MAEKTIPLLPCRSELIEPLLDFYTALGFGTTFHQKSPYAYVVVERGTVELQFLGMKEYDPAASYSGCYILTDDVEGLYEAFRSGLKSAYGRIPARGLPRIGPLKDMSYGVRQFLMTDPTGNSIRIGQPISDDGSHRPCPRRPSPARCIWPISSWTPRRTCPERCGSSTGHSRRPASGPPPRSRCGCWSSAAISRNGSATTERPAPCWTGPPRWRPRASPTPPPSRS